MKLRSADATQLILFTVYAVALVFGCATIGNAPGPKMQAAPLPDYLDGTTFVYSDGTWETVIESKPTQVTWSDHLGNVSSGTPDFVFRRERWQSGKREGTRQFIPGGADSLWPLRKGNTIRYTEIGTWRDGSGTSKSYESQWTCRVAGTEEVSVLAGNFDTWKITCRRDSAGAASGKMRKRENKTWYYAPGIGHYVLSDRTYYDKRNPRRMELVAVLPPTEDLTPEERHLLQSRFQQAMEHQPSGQSVSWPKTGSLFAGEITPIDTFRTLKGTYCRRYVQKFYLPEGQRIYYGMALRDPQGRWVVPRHQAGSKNLTFVTDTDSVGSGRSDHIRWRKLRGSLRFRLTNHFIKVFGSQRTEAKKWHLDRFEMLMKVMWDTSPIELSRNLSGGLKLRINRMDKSKRI